MNDATSPEERPAEAGAVTDADGAPPPAFGSIPPCESDAAHTWKPAGNCSHGYGGSTRYGAYICATCGQGGHSRKPGFACPRRAETDRPARIARQIAACPVWARLTETAQKYLTV